MKNKGFTLVELLAVIVILGIIALIATPIILNIIRNARNEANQRSIDMYASAVKNAIATYELKEGDSPSAIEDVEKYITYDGDPVVCATRVLYEDSKIYLANCTVDGKSIDYEYGEYQPVKLSDVCNPVGSTIYSKEEGTAYNCKVDPNKDEYTFYVLNSTTDTEVNLIMDSNINISGEAVKSSTMSDKGFVAWKENGNVIEGPITAMDYLVEATKNWTNLEKKMIDSYEQRDEWENSTEKPLSKVYSTYARLPKISEIQNTSPHTLYLIDYLDNSQDENISSSLTNPLIRNGVTGLRGYWVSGHYIEENGNCGGSADVIDLVTWASCLAEANNKNQYGVRPVITLKI